MVQLFFVKSVNPPVVAPGIVVVAGELGKAGGAERVGAAERGIGAEVGGRDVAAGERETVGVGRVLDQAGAGALSTVAALSMTEVRALSGGRDGMGAAIHALVALGPDTLAEEFERPSTSHRSRAMPARATTSSTTHRRPCVVSAGAAGSSGGGS